MSGTQIAPGVVAVGLQRQATERRPTPEDIREFLDDFRFTWLLYYKGIFPQQGEIH